MKTESETGVMQPSARDGLSRSWKIKDALLVLSDEALPSGHLDFRFLVHRAKRMNVFSLKPPCLW